MTITVKKIAIAGVLSAVEIVLGITGLGLIMLPFGAAVTILQVPAIIGAVLEGPLVGFFIGLLFGIFSIIQSALVGATPIDMAFVSYPFLAIIPRALIGPAAWLVYALVTGRIRKGAEHTVKPAVELCGAALGAAAGSLTNTVLVLSGLGLFKIIPWEMIFPVAALNGPLEAAASVIIACAVIALWKRIPSGGKSRLTKDAEKRAA
jgi:uncharacterized membrane protein